MSSSQFSPSLHRLNSHSPDKTVPPPPPATLSLNLLPFLTQAGLGFCVDNDISPFLLYLACIYFRLTDKRHLRRFEEIRKAEALFQ